MNKDLVNMKMRTKDFALRVIRLYTALPKRGEGEVLGKQIFRSGTSVGAQFREGVRSKSKADLINKLEGCLQELEETQYWLELLIDAEIIDKKRLEPLYQESDELISIFVTIVKKLKGIHNS
ncbi:MAG: four helix bundle protein [bacterium]|nr:four helix bundle protein [bacterium]